jgi:hypothetical protein
MTETITRKQSVVDELWKRANQLIENYDGEMFGSNVIINMNMRILEDKLMTSNEFHSWAYDEDLEAVQDYIWVHTKDHPKSPYREQVEV